MKFTLLYDQEQSKAELIERLILKPWQGYCLKNWLNENHAQIYAPEHKVKRLLDHCGTLLLRDVPPEYHDTLTSYKEMIIGSREINLSDCPEAITELAESGALALSLLSADDKLRLELLKDRLHARNKETVKEKPRQSTRFDRLEAIRRRYPGCKMEICRVDVDGFFSFGGRNYQVDSTRGKYAPHKTRYGDQYDMDRIIGIQCTDGTVKFADQDGYEMDHEMIEVQEKVNG